MSKFSRSVIPAAILSCFTGTSAAEDELVLHVFRDGVPAPGIAIALDGGAAHATSAAGAFVADLGAGPHSVQLTDNGMPLHAFRFDVASGQNVDISVSLSHGKPQVAIEAYAKSEAGAAERNAPRGSLSGRVTLGGAPLQNAVLVVHGLGKVASTDADGRYRLELPRGSYVVEVQHAQLDAPRKQPLRIVSGLDRHHDLALQSAQAAPVAAEAAEVVVLAQRPVEETERSATSVIDTINAEELARAGGTDVAASVIRVPSITVQADRYVFIRGLGDRYVSTTLNGATMPSTDPSRRTVPLDLFPTNIVSQLDVRKTFTAAMPGESTGGNLVINTRSFPAEAGGALGLSFGYTSGLTGSTVYSDPTRGDWDFLGADDGSREEDGLLPLISAALEHSDEYSDNTRTELLRAGALLIKDDLDLDTRTATPKGTLNLNYGDVFDVGAGLRLGYFAAGNFSNGWTQRSDGIARTYAGTGDTLDDFRFEEHTNTIEDSGLLALGLDAGDHRFGANTLLSRATESSVRVMQGIEGDEFHESFRYNIEWVERQFVSQQISGEHRFGELLGKWQLTGSQAKRYAPDRREVRFDLVAGDDVDPDTGDIIDGAGTGLGVYNLEVPSLLRRYDDLVDDNWDLSSDWAYDFGRGTLAAGGQLITRQRDSESRSYGFRGDNGNAPNLRVSDVINLDTITGDQANGYEFDDKTLPSDSYEADLDLYAGYLSYDLMLNAWQIVIGGRYEQFKQTTDTYSLEGEQEAVRSTLDEGVFLPSLAVNWFISDANQLRAAASRTVARPDFKETSNATFYDNEFDFRVRGNPLLGVSKISNFDLRYEHYWNANESASLAVFYKDMQNPIERVLVSASGTVANTRTYQNARSARIYGVEVDGRREFAINDAYTRSLFVAVNASYIESEVELDGGRTRDLQGQPDYTVNLIVGYDDIPTRQQLTLLLNQSGETIQDVGVGGLPDIIEEPRLSLNLNYRYAFVDKLAFKFRAVNLLDAEIEFTQGGKVFQRYRKGVEFDAGIDWRF